MPVTRIGVQAVTGSPGQIVDIDPARITATITNAGSVAVEYSTGGAWTSIAAGASASVSCDTHDLRLRRGVSGAYPAPVDIDWTATSEGEATSLTEAQARAVQALVSGAWKTSDEPVLITGDSITAGAISGSSNPVNYAMAAQTGRWVCAGNAGVGGQTSTQIAARLASDMLNAGATSAVIGSCYWNDVGTSVALADSIAAYRSMIATVQARGGKIWFVAPTPDGAGVVNSGTRTAIESRYNALRATCQGVAGVIDVWPTLVDVATGALSSTYNADNSVHPNEAGNLVIGGAIAAALNAGFPGQPLGGYRTVFDATDRLAGSGAFLTASGGVGTGWTGASATGTTVSVSAGRQIFTSVGATGGASYVDSALITATAGDLIEIRGTLAYDGGAVYPRIRGLMSGANTSSYPIIEFRGTLASPSPFHLRWRMLTGQTGIQVRVQAVGTGNSVMSVGGIVVRNLGQA